MEGKQHYDDFGQRLLQAVIGAILWVGAKTIGKLFRFIVVKYREQRTKPIWTMYAKRTTVFAFVMAQFLMLFLVFGVLTYIYFWTKDDSVTVYINELRTEKDSLQNVVINLEKQLAERK